MRCQFDITKILNLKKMKNTQVKKKRRNRRHLSYLNLVSETFFFPDMCEGLRKEWKKTPIKNSSKLYRNFSFLSYIYVLFHACFVRHQAHEKIGWKKNKCINKF